MRYILLAIMYCLQLSIANAQIINPGGVKGNVLWYITSDSANAPYFKSFNILKNNVKPQTTNSVSVSQFNFHPAIQMNGFNEFVLPLTGINLKSASFFVVYQTIDTTYENLLWHISNNKTATLVSTTARMADLTRYHYMNYTDLQRGTPKINIYQQLQDSAFDDAHSTLRIGGKPVSPVLPVTGFTGTMPEFLVFDRVLSSVDRLKVASYLSLKYGITLADPAGTYLNSTGTVIWNGQDYHQYHFNIAGIGRDDSSGLVQKIATSGNTPGLITFSTKDSISNNSFLIWGENNLPFTLEDKLPGMPVLFKKKWLMVSSDWNKNNLLDITLDAKKMDAFTPPGAACWLAIDSSAEGNFSFDNTAYYKMNSMDKNGFLHFTNQFFKTSEAEKYSVSFLIENNLFVPVKINPPTCAPYVMGSLQIKAVGGKKPVNITIENKASKLVKTYTLNDDESFPIPDIASGKYSLTAQDAAQNFYTDSFYVNNADAPAPVNLQSSYQLQNGRSLIIKADGEAQTGASYFWQGPDNFTAASSQVTITEPGNYVLTTTANNCPYYQDILVTKPAENAFSKIIIYPNPSTGTYTLQVALNKAAQLFISVYTNDGRLISKKEFTGMANYSLTDKLTVSGTYNIVFQSGQSVESRKLLIAR